MLAFISVFEVKSIWRIRLNEKIFDFRVLALNVFVFTSDVLRVFHSSFEELLTVRLLFIVSFNMKFSRYIAFGKFPYLMEMEGFEPLTPCLQGRCSPN